MKKTLKLFALLIAITISSNLFAQTTGSILANGIRMISVVYPGQILPFENTSSSKIGFFRNDSYAEIAIEPTFDDVYVDNGPLMPVMRNGKWGVVDVSLRGLTTIDQQPIIPCEYDCIDIVDGSSVRAISGDKIFTIKLVMHGYDVTVEKR